MSEIQYRIANVGDARIIAETHCASWRTTYPTLMPATVIAEWAVVEARTQRWTEIIETKSSNVWLAFDEHTPCSGFCSFGINRCKDVQTDGQVNAIYLVDSAQRKGIGRALISIAFEALHRVGYQSVCVEVLKDNPAEKFYRAMGGEHVFTTVLEMSGHILTEHIYVWEKIPRIMPNPIQTAPQV